MVTIEEIKAKYLGDASWSDEKAKLRYAYSIVLETLKDEWNQKTPLSAKQKAYIKRQVSEGREAFGTIAAEIYRRGIK